MSDPGNRQRKREMDLLHQLRSSLARSLAEAERLGLDHVSIRPLVDALMQTLSHLTALEDAVYESIAHVDHVRTLVIDDDTRLAQLTAERLKARGILSEYSNVLDAAFSRPREDILIIDLGVLAEASQEQRSSLRGRTLIVVSGENSANAREKAIALGATCFFLKPVRINDLTTRILAIREEQT